MREIKSIAITGKGGTGKTMLATIMIRLLAERYHGGVLAIDADSAMSLPYTLGIPVQQTVSRLRKEVIGPGQLRDKMKSQDLSTWMGSILAHGDGFDLLTMGRPEEPGCFCAVNELLRYAIDALINSYKITVIDGEAGPEQLNRRVLKSIDVLLVVSDMSARSLSTAKGIIDVARAQESGIEVKRAGLVLNRVLNDHPLEELVQKTGLEIFGSIPEDKTLNEFDREGRPLLELPRQSPSVTAIEKLCQMLLSDEII
ncbi:MAG: AAA family ATPase [Negativicutes bacterium]|nr:AAA family ATPase [Negativicutes bacterium]